MIRRLHAWSVHFFIFACNCIECWHLAKLLWKFSCPSMRYYTVIREMFIFDFWYCVVAWPEGRLVTCIYIYSIHNIFNRLFGKHLSVLNFIRQANNCMSDYWIEQLIHPHIHSHISTYPNTQASKWMHTFTSQFLLSSIPLYVQDQWENRTVWQIVIQFTIENATWRFKCASFDSSARIMSERDAFDQIEFFFIRFIYIKYFIYCHVWHTITSTIPSHTRLNIQYICNTSVVFRRCLCRSCSILPYFEHIFTWMAPISIANECFCSVFNVRPSLTPTILSFRLFYYTVTYIYAVIQHNILNL